MIDGGIFIRNDSGVKWGIHHVIDSRHPGAPLGPEPTDVLEPGQSIVLFKHPGVEYVVGHYDSVQPWRIEKNKVLKDGTIRRDLGREHRAWPELAPQSKEPMK